MGLIWLVFRFDQLDAIYFDFMQEDTGIGFAIDGDIRIV